MAPHTSFACNVATPPLTISTSVEKQVKKMIKDNIIKYVFMNELFLHQYLLKFAEHSKNIYRLETATEIMKMNKTK